MARLESGGKRGESKENVKGWYIDSEIKIGVTSIYLFKRTSIFSREEIPVQTFSEKMAWAILRSNLKALGRLK